MGAPTDFNIICGTTVFPAHRAIFATASNYLLEMFSKVPNGTFLFIVHGVQPIDVEHLLTFVYKSNVQVNRVHSPGFISAANQLKIDSLIKQEVPTKKQKPIPVVPVDNTSAEKENVAPLKSRPEENSVETPIVNDISNKKLEAIRIQPEEEKASTPPELIIRIPFKTQKNKENVPSKSKPVQEGFLDNDDDDAFKESIKPRGKGPKRIIKQQIPTSNDLLSKEIKETLNTLPEKCQVNAENVIPVLTVQVDLPVVNSADLPQKKVKEKEKAQPKKAVVKVQKPDKKSKPVEKKNTLEDAPQPEQMRSEGNQSSFVPSPQPPKKAKEKAPPKPKKAVVKVQKPDKKSKPLEKKNTLEDVPTIQSGPGLSEANQFEFVPPPPPKKANRNPPEVKTVLGRPILSSTKLDPLNPKILDKSEKYFEKRKEIFRDKGDFIETPNPMVIKSTQNHIHTNNTNKESQTFLVQPSIPKKNQENKIMLDTPQLPLIKKRGRPRKSIAQPVNKAKNNGGFCVAELVDQLQKKLDVSEKTDNVPSTSASGLKSASNATKTIQDSGGISETPVKATKLPQKRKYTRKLVNKNKNAFTTTEENPFMKMRRLDLDRRSKSKSRGIMNKITLRGTDDSSGELPTLAVTIRKKVPVGKRRRKPAKNRPTLLLTSATNSILPLGENIGKFKRQRKVPLKYQ